MRGCEAVLGVHLCFHCCSICMLPCMFPLCVELCIRCVPLKLPPPPLNFVCVSMCVFIAPQSEHQTPSALSHPHKFSLVGDGVITMLSWESKWSGLNGSEHAANYIRAHNCDGETDMKWRQPSRYVHRKRRGGELAHAHKGGMNTVSYKSCFAPNSSLFTRDVIDACSGNCNYTVFFNVHLNLGKQAPSTRLNSDTPVFNPLTPR